METGAYGSERLVTSSPQSCTCFCRCGSCGLWLHPRFWNGFNFHSAYTSFSSSRRYRLSCADMPFIPFKSNTQPDRGTDIWSKMFYFITTSAMNSWPTITSCSNVESVFQMIKSKFGEKLRSKNETAQINEALTKVLAHNLCVVIQSMYELNVTPEFWSEAA